MKNKFTFWLTFILFVAAAYFPLSFVAWSFDISEWNWFLRFCWIASALLLVFTKKNNFISV